MRAGRSMRRNFAKPEIATSSPVATVAVIRSVNDVKNASASLPRHLIAFCELVQQLTAIHMTSIAMLGRAGCIVARPLPSNAWISPQFQGFFDGRSSRRIRGRCPRVRASSGPSPSPLCPGTWRGTSRRRPRRRRSPGSAPSAGETRCRCWSRCGSSCEPSRNGSASILADALGDLDRGGDAFQPGQHDRELVAAHAGDDVAGPDAAAQPGRDRDEQVVADVVAVAVVHVLEPVEVEEQHRDEVAGAAAAAHPFELLGEAAPVRQLGERVVRRLVRRAGPSAPRSSRCTWALRSDAPAWAANSSRLSGAAGGGPARASRRSPRRTRRRPS